jgi:hypothetical protein
MNSHWHATPYAPSRRRRGNWFEVHAQGRVYWERVCERYRIDCYPIPGSETGERFTAWYIGSNVELLGCYDTSKQAVARCAAHYRSMNRATT